MTKPVSIPAVRFAALVVAAVALFLGCGKDTAPRDRSPAGAESSGALSVAAEPSLDLATTAAVFDTALGLVAWVAVTDAHSLVVADRGSGRIVILDSTGTVSQLLGREGTGPDEFQDPTWIGHCGGDTLFVWDRILSRLTLFESNGRYVRQSLVAAGPLGLTCGREGLFAGIVLTDPRFDPRMRADAAVTNGAITLFSSTGDSVGWISEVPVLRNRPLGGRAHLAIVGDTIVFGFSESVHVNLYSRTGLVTKAIDVGKDRAPPSRSNYEAAVDETLRELPSPSERSAFRNQFLAIPMPPKVPAYRGILSDPDGNLWVVTTPLGNRQTTVDILRLDGTWVSTFRFPGELVPTDVSRDAIVGFTNESDGAQRILMYRYGAR